MPVSVIHDSSRLSLPSSPAHEAMQRLGVGLAAHAEDHLVEPGMKADHVALLDGHAVLLQDLLQLVVGDGVIVPAEVPEQVDHDGPTLHAVPGEVLDAQHVGAGILVGRPSFRPLATFRDLEPVPGAVAVVEGDLGLPGALGVEEAADMRQPVPLRRILRVQQHDVVGNDVGEERIVAPQGEAEALLAGALACPQGGESGAADGGSDAARCRREDRAAGTG